MQLNRNVTKKKRKQNQPTHRDHPAPIPIDWWEEKRKRKEENAEENAKRRVAKENAEPNAEPNAEQNAEKDKL